MTSEPTTDREWTIHALNIHGSFFERWCEATVSSARGWRVRATHYPVEFPSPNGPFRGTQSHLDIRGDLWRGDEAVLTALIECKKNNPGLTNWVFLLRN